MLFEQNQTNLNSYQVNSVNRSQDDIITRIRELEKEINRNDVWIDTGIISKSQEPTSLRKQNILNGKILELKWMLGEEIEITEGVL